MTSRYRDRLTPLVLALATFSGPALGEDAPNAPAKPSKESQPIELSVTPAPVPTPVLKYRLFPIESDRTPGDAAPIYIRLSLNVPDAARKEIVAQSNAWLDLPLDQFPTADARKLVDRWSAKLEQIAFGARRQTCHWNYTLAEQKEHVIEILLPDMQEMRLWCRLLALKARVETAEKKYDEAIRTIETGFAFSQHVGDGPFLITTLVGLACDFNMLARVDELVARPGAPNLYWGLTALPRPLISMRPAMENELKTGEWLVPELAEADSPHTEAEWSALLGRLHARLMDLQKFSVMEEGARVHVGQETTLARFRAENLTDARAYFKERGRPTEGMSDDQVLFLSLVARSRELRDDGFRLFYLPYSEAAPFFAETAERSKGAKDGPLAIFAELLPAHRNVKVAETRAERKVAALRIVEALRLHAAKVGRLPESLDEVKDVPIPLDPFTGKPFSYRIEGDAAVLSGPPPSPEHPALTYRIRLQK